jgi:hypothetical protein
MSPKPTKEDLEAEGMIVSLYPLDGREIGANVLEAYPEHAQLIRCIVAGWSQLEMRLVVWLQALFSSDAPALEPMIYAIESSRARIDAMQSAFEQLMPADQLPHVRTLLRSAAKLLTVRNKYAHALYVVTLNTRELAILKRGGQSGFTRLPLSELTHQLQRMKEVSHAIGLASFAATQESPPEPPAPDTPPAHPPD